MPGRSSSPPPGKHCNPYFLSLLFPPLLSFFLSSSLWIVIMVTSFSHLCSYLIKIYIFFTMLILYFISHQGDIPTSEAPKPSDSTFSTIYTVFFCLFVCFSWGKQCQRTYKRISCINEWLTSFISSAPPVAFVVIVNRRIDFSKWWIRYSSKTH